MKYLVSLCIAVIFCLVMPNSVANSAIAKVLLAVGDFTVVREGQSSQLKRRSVIYQGDKLVVGSRSQGQLRFKDNSMLSLYANTTFIVDEYRYDSQDKMNTASRFQLVRGTLRSLTGKIADESPGSYQLTTDVATIGVRGTIIKVGLESLDEDLILYAVVEGKNANKLVVTPCALGDFSGCDPTKSKILAAGSPFNSAVVIQSKEDTNVETGANLGAEFFAQAISDSVASVGASDADLPLTQDSESQKSNETNNSESGETNTQQNGSQSTSSEQTESANEENTSDSNEEDSSLVAFSAASETSDGNQASTTSDVTDNTLNVDNVSSPVASSTDTLNTSSDLNTFADPIVGTSLSLAEFLNIPEGQVTSTLTSTFNQRVAVVYEGSSQVYSGLGSDTTTEFVTSATENFPATTLTESQVAFAGKAAGAFINTFVFLPYTDGGDLNFGETWGSVQTNGAFTSPQVYDASSMTIIDTAPLRSFFIATPKFGSLPTGTINYTNVIDFLGSESDVTLTDINAGASSMSLTVNFTLNTTSGNFSVLSNAGNTWASGALNGTLNPSNGNLVFNGTGLVNGSTAFTISDDTFKSSISGTNGKGIHGGFNLSDGSKRLVGVFGVEE